MFTFTARESVIIDERIEQVFDYIADSRNDDQWCPAVKEIRTRRCRSSRPMPTRPS